MIRYINTLSLVKANFLKWVGVTSLVYALIAGGSFNADALGTAWQPLDRPVEGKQGTGAHGIVSGMLVYSTPPARPYVILGLITATNGLFGSPRTRAVAAAKKVGADALILLDSDVTWMGTATNFYGTGFQNQFGNSNWGSFSGTSNSNARYSVTGYYAAIKWSGPASPIPIRRAQVVSQRPSLPEDSSTSPGSAPNGGHP